MKVTLQQAAANRLTILGLLAEGFSNKGIQEMTGLTKGVVNSVIANHKREQKNKPKPGYFRLAESNYLI